MRSVVGDRQDASLNVVGHATHDRSPPQVDLDTVEGAVAILCSGAT
jgi:hypothetical protein